MNITASGLNRFRRCPGSAVLPQVRKSSEHAERGREIHSFLERAAVLPKDKALEGVPPELYDLCKRIDVGAILGEYADIQTEMSFALDPIARKARFLGRSLGRNYKCEESEIAGSEDLICKLKLYPSKWVTLDYKSGDYTGPVRTNSQLLFFSSCLHLMYGADEVNAVIVYLNDDGSHEIDQDVHTIFDINDYLDALAEACKAYYRCIDQFKLHGTATVNPGDHCQYCSSMPNCPAYIGLAKRILPDLTDIASRITSLTPEDAGKAWMLKKQIAEIFYQVDDGLKEYARNFGIDLPNNKRVGTTSFVKKFFSEKEAVKMLEALGAKPEEIASCYSQKPIVSVRELKRKDLPVLQENGKKKQ